MGISLEKIMNAKGRVYINCKEVDEPICVNDYLEYKKIEREIGIDLATLVKALKDGIYIYHTIQREPFDTIEETIHNPKNHPIILLKENDRERIFGMIIKKEIHVDFEKKCFYYYEGGIFEYNIPCYKVRFYFNNRGKKFEYGWGMSEEELK